MPAVPHVLQALAPLLAVVHQEGESSSCSSTCVRNWKIGFTAILIAEGLLFSHLIFIFRRFFAKSPHLIDRATLYGHAVSAGIFLATAFMHILPEAVELLAGEHGGAHSDEGTDGAQNAEGEGDHDDHDHGEEHDEEEEEEEAPQFQESRLQTRLVRALAKAVVRQEDDHDHEGDHDDHDDHDDHGEEGHKLEFPWAMFTLLMAFYLLFFIEKIIVPAILKKANARVSAKVSDEENETAEQGLTAEGGDGHGHDHDHEHGLAAPEDVEAKGGSDGKLPGIMSVSFLVVATQVVGLSAHSLFESIALGIGSSITRVVNIFIATVTHRWATALGISVIVSRRVSYVGFIALIAFFTLVVPIGVGIGAGVSGISEQVQGVLFAVSAGTFLYIGMIEGLGAAFSGQHKESRLLLFMAMFLGSAFIIVVTGILVAAGVEH